MTVETFLANFGHLADAPNGVRKLRELILQLAVQGKLVQQDPTDEPAAKLLEKIRKGELVKPAKDLQPVKFDELPHELPSTWEWVRFRQIVDFNIGRTPPTKVSAYWDDSGIPWVSIADLEHYEKIAQTKKCVSEKARAEIFRSAPTPRGTILMSFKLTIGKISLLDVDAYHNEAIISIFPANRESRDFLFRVLPVVAASGDTSNAIKGKTLNSDSLANLLFPLPPLAEQHRIVAKVDQLMALCDELEARQQKQQEGRVRLNNAALDALLNAGDPADFASHWQRIAANFDLLYDHPDTIAKLRAAILQLAVQGKLVPQDPGDEPAEVLFARIKVEKEKMASKGKIKASKFLQDTEPVLGCLPKTWKETRLGEITALGPQNGYSPRPVEFETGTKSLTLSATTKGKFDPLCFKYVDESIEDESSLWLEEGDILIQRGNSLDYVGIGAVYHGPEREYIYPDLMMKIRVVPSIDVGFAHLVINCQYSREFFRGNASGTSGSMPKINQSVVNSLPFPLPPEAEQKRIVAKVDQLMALCDALEAKLNQAREQSEKLMEASVRQLLVG